MISTPFCSVCGAANELAHTRCFACGQLLATGNDGAAALEGALLSDRYQPGVLLGSGGFSTVYHARDMREGGRDVAIKQINLQGLSPEETIDATDTFNREVNLLSLLQHPQIPRLYDHFSDSDHWYLVLEYLEGSTLELYLEKRATQGRVIQVDEALAMVLQLCVVLEYLHTRQPPVIFRDLKPGNIIRTPGGKLCLIDFGIARHFRPGQMRDTQRLGSPGYAAPEQYGRSQTTPQADIYSLGALLHALLSGEDPSTQPRGLTPLRLEGYAGEAELADLVQRMLSPDPMERPARSSEVAAVLKDILALQRTTHDGGRIWVPPIPQEPLPTTPGQKQIQIMLHTPPGQVVLPAAPRRTKRRNVLIGLGTLAVALAGGQVIWQTLAARPFPVPLPQPGPADLLYTYQGHTDAVWNAVWAPAHLRVASCSLDQTVQIWDAFTGNNAFIYRGHAAALCDATWSPDGQRIASSSVDRTVQLWDAASGSNALIYRGHADAVQEANWSPDGTLIASCSLDRTVQIWSATNGSLINTYRGHRDAVDAAKWSPDGLRIASSSLDNTVQIWDALTMRTILTYEGHSAAVSEVAWSPDGTRVASASNDGTAQVWDAADGGNVLIYTDHTGPVNGVAWSSDGTRIVSGSDDNTVQIWDAFDGSHIFTYTGHTQPVIEANWSFDDSMIASASEDSTVQVWRAL